MKKKTSLAFDMGCIALCGALLACCINFGPSAGEALYKGFGVISRFSVENISLPRKESADSASTSDYVFSPKGFGSGGLESDDITKTPGDIASLMASAQALYKTLEKSGTIKEQQLGGGNVSYGAVKINNRTDENIDIKKLLDSKPDYKKITKDEPYILVYHTHTTEGYELLDKGWYSSSYNSRTTDSSVNMVRVGEELVKYLEKAGYKVIHDKNIYDKSYNGAYDRSRQSVEKYLNKYPSVQITLDVHRDAIHYDGNVKSKPTALINGKKAAQVMIISGCEGDGVSGFPDWEKNLAFAASLQNAAEESFSGLMRPIFFCNRKYNMNLTSCSLLLEFGTDANTLEEAVYSAALIGKTLGEMLNKNEGV